MSLRGHARRLRREDVFMLLKRFFPYLAVGVFRVFRVFRAFRVYRVYSI